MGTNTQNVVKYTVAVSEPPEIKKSPKNGYQKATKGENITFSCIGKGNPEPIITWTRLNNKLPDGSDQFENSHLSFENVNKEHSGTYFCSSKGGLI